MKVDIISEEAEEQFEFQQRGKPSGYPELTPREKTASLKSALRIIESTKLESKVCLYGGIIFLSGGLSAAIFGDSLIGGWSKIFWLAVFYGTFKLVLYFLGTISMYKSVVNRPDRVFIEENGQAIHRHYYNAGFDSRVIRVGELETK